MDSFSSSPLLTKATICEFGYADQKILSGRSTLLMRALQSEGFRVNPLLVDPRSRGKSIQLALKARKTTSAQFVFLRFPYFPWMVRCALLLRKRLKAKLIVDAMVSAYETVIEDRALAKPDSRRAHLCLQEDLLIGQEADLLICDTNTHAHSLANKLGCSTTKMSVVPVGSPLYELADPKQTPPPEAPPAREIEVLYVGTFVPLHGIAKIIEAARLVSSKASHIRFTFVGHGQDYDYARELAADMRTVQFRTGLTTADIRAEIQKADIILGIFGSSEKASVVVPFKVYDALAFGRAAITARTTATEEMLTHGKDSWLISSDPASLAQAIEQLASDSGLRKGLAKGARDSYQARFHSSVTIKSLARRLDEMSQA